MLLVYYTDSRTDCLCQVEKLLAEISSMEGGTKERPGNGSSLEARTRIYERLASEVARLNFYTARGKASAGLK